MPLIVAEPAAAYPLRPPLVVDASVIAAAIFDEEQREAAQGWLRGRRLCAPQLLDYEITSIALVKVRRGVADLQMAHKALEDFASLDIERHPVDAIALCALARLTALSSYDAAYLWLASELSAPLATFDRRLGTAARTLFEGDG
jgi:predicted nucleic acid-binding protein